MKKNKSQDKQSSQSAGKGAQSLSKKDQRSTNGGGLLGGDDSSSTLISQGNVNLHSSSTDEDGETKSNQLGGNFGSGSLLANKED